MSYIRFNHVFASLLAVSALSGFVIPEKYTSKPLPAVQAVFAPVSLPVRRVGAWAHERVGSADPGDRRAAQELRDENLRLATAVDYLEKQLDVERKRNADWEQLGSLRERCVRVTVSGADAGTRDSLLLPGSTLGRIRDGSYALYPGGVAGQVRGRAGFGGAQLTLITDRGFRALGHFARRTEGGPSEQLTKTPVLFEGVGGGAMVVRAAVTWEEVEKYQRVQVGDVALLADRDWPLELQGQRLGVVTKVEPMRDAPKFAEIRIEPSVNLMMLKEVMVLAK
jgi:hypothetical protein